MIRIAGGLPEIDRSKQVSRSRPFSVKPVEAVANQTDFETSVKEFESRQVVEARNPTKSEQQHPSQGSNGECGASPVSSSLPWNAICSSA
ncbi:hypothetical protein [Stratiformator vulcanicus]|uniref:hypothetical protein n=1 Tax=Stratiformator vulcanicus TaxID=2527980 RepID=UPI0011AA4AA4|nr:hypothetical protein [Stratiformator vulcanicus]